MATSGDHELAVDTEQVAGRAKALIRELRKQSGTPTYRQRKKAAKALNQTNDVLGALTSALKGGQPISAGRMLRSPLIGS